MRLGYQMSLLLLAHHAIFPRVMQEKERHETLESAKQDQTRDGDLAEHSLF